MARAAGFTLVELVIALALAAIVVAIAIPNVSGVMDAGRLHAATTMLASKLAEARMNALKRNRPVALVIDPVRGRVLVEAIGPGGTPLVIGAPGLLPAGVAFVEPVPQIQFDAVGRPTNPPPRTLVVELSSSRARRGVGVSAAGTIRRE